MGVSALPSNADEPAQAGQSLPHFAPLIYRQSCNSERCLGFARSFLLATSTPKMACISCRLSRVSLVCGCINGIPLSRQFLLSERYGEFRGVALSGLALASFSRDRTGTFRLPLLMFFFGLMVLSRLDDIFFLLPVLILVWRLHGGGPRRRVMAAVALPIAMIAAYLIYNRISVGVFMPTSGSVKAGLAISQNLITPSAWYCGTMVANHGWGQKIFQVFMRMFQMLAPMSLAASPIRRDRARSGAIEALCVGVLLKGAYNFSMSRLSIRAPGTSAVRSS